MHTSMNTTDTLTEVRPVVARNVTKRYGRHTALKGLTLDLPEGRVVGLLGRNGAGKSTLLNLASGLILPSEGTIETLGVPTVDLDTPQLTRLGVVQQEGRCIEWMTVRQHLDFNASFYPGWDRDLERRLTEALEVDPKRRIAELSPGDRQKVGILLGVCHRPSLLLLDEPAGALDPIVRMQLLDVLLERLRDDGCTMVISSHLLSDVEKIVDWVIALDAGELVENAAYDELQESFAEWTVLPRRGELPGQFDEPYVLSREGNWRQAVMRVRTAEPDAAARFAERHDVEVRSRPLNLEEMFPLITRKRTT